MKQVIDIIKNLTGKDAAVKSRLMGGRSNLTFVVLIDNEKYTFRIPGKNAEEFVDRVDELNNINTVDDLEINNKTELLDTKKGYKLAKYVKGTPLQETDDLHLLEVTSLLKILHGSSKRFDKDYKPFTRLTKYEELNGDLTTSYLKTRKWLFEYKEYLEDLPKCMCHNDSQRSNIVIGEKNYLLDWEFAGNNDFYYDIACFGNQEFLDALRLLEVYLGREPLDQEYNRLTLWRSFQCLQWHNVASYKHHCGLSEELDVPFDFIAKEYLETANSLLSSLK